MIFLPEADYIKSRLDTDFFNLQPCPRHGGDCFLIASYDPKTLTTRIQHGDNPEHELLLADEAMLSSWAPFEIWHGLRPVIAEWINRIHEYEAL